MRDDREVENWKNKKFWKCGFYFCPKDTRLWVPKQDPSRGTTWNMAHPVAKWTVILFFVFFAIMIVFLLGAFFSQASF